MGPGKESVLIRQCNQYLGYLQNMKKLAFRRITVSGVPHFNTRQNKINFSKNIMAGMSDYLVFLKHREIPVTLHIECKSEKGVMSEAQIEWQNILKSVGHDTYFMIRNIDDLKSILLKYGITL